METVIPNIDNLKFGMDCSNYIVKFIRLHSLKNTTFQNSQGHEADVRATVTAALQECINAFEELYTNKFFRLIMP